MEITSRDNLENSLSTDAMDGVGQVEYSMCGGHMKAVACSDKRGDQLGRNTDPGVREEKQYFHGVKRDAMIVGETQRKNLPCARRAKTYLNVSRALSSP